MKILAVSLLRLGDLAMVAQALWSLKQKNPKAEIHLLTNWSNAPLAKMLRPVDRLHWFDRQNTQESLGEIDRSQFEAFDRMSELVKSLNLEAFDQVINLTQNRLSAYICGMVQADDYMGMLASETTKIHFTSPWFRHLNNYVASEGKDSFHYVDFFREAIGAHSKPQSAEELYNFSESTNYDFQNKILVQAWSSDPKKDYPPELWKCFFRNYKKLNPRAEFLVIGAPDEKERVDSFINAVSSIESQIDGLCIKFADLLSVLPKQQMLISVDTSTKHIAAQSGIKIIELALGSSQPRKTGVYSEGALIIRSRANCWPCSHSENCQQSSHLCSQSIDPQALAMVVHEFQLGNWPSLRVLAEEFHQHFYLGRVGFTGTGLWHTRSLHPVEWQSEKEQLINVECWRFTLHRKHLLLDAPYKEVARQLGPSVLDSHQLKLERLESSSRQTEMSVDRLSRLVSERSKSILEAGGDLELMGQLQQLQVRLGLGEFLSQNLNGPQTGSLASLRGLQEAINEIRNFQVTKTNIIKSMRKLEHGASV